MGNPAKLLACDMDGTIIPLSDLEGQREALRRFKEKGTHTPNLQLGYVTGRHLELGLMGVRQHDLPMPHVFVCDVGTSIYFRENGRWRPDESYAKKLRRSWNDQGDTIERLLRNVRGLRMQETEKQGEFKKSYYADPALERRGDQATYRGHIPGQGNPGQPDLQFDTVKNVGLLDVLPPVAAKDAALHHIVAAFHLERDMVFYAGDSGNDLLAFLSGYRAILVANTDEPTRQRVLDTARRKKFLDRIYCAEAPYTAGVLEGCAFFKVFD